MGRGAYGDVYKCRDLQTGRYVAMKTIKPEETEEDGIPVTTLREITVLKRLKHKNIISLENVVMES